MRTEITGNLLPIFLELSRERPTCTWLRKCDVRVFAADRYVAIDDNIVPLHVGVMAHHSTDHVAALIQGHLKTINNATRPHDGDGSPITRDRLRWSREETASGRQRSDGNEAESECVAKRTMHLLCQLTMTRRAADLSSVESHDPPTAPTRAGCLPPSAQCPFGDRS